MKRAWVTPLLAAVVACSATPAPTLPTLPSAAPPPVVASVEPPPPARPAFDPFAVATSVDGTKRLCDERLKAAQLIVDELRALKSAPSEKLTFASTLGRFDDVMLEIANASDLPSVLGLAHPDEAVRGAAKLCEAKADRFRTTVLLDDDLATVLRAYAAKGERLDGERERYLAEVLRDLRRSGIDLAPDKRQRLVEIEERVLRIEQEFMGNIASDVGHVLVPASSLEGLPPEYVARHPLEDVPDPHSRLGQKMKRIDITTNQADYGPFLEYAKDRRAALDLYVAALNRGGEENVRRLGELLRLRREKAKLLGYASWAAFVLETRMAKSPDKVRSFLERTLGVVKEAAKSDLAELVKENVKAGAKSTDKITPADQPFLEHRLRKARWSLDSREVARYFAVEAVTKSALDLIGELYGLTFTKSALAAWHPDVMTFDVARSGAPVGKLLLDLYGRRNKFKFTAAFAVRTGKRLTGGDVQLPIAALLANFQKPDDTGPALLEHDDVVTLFHELGHAVHHLVGAQELASHAPLSGPRDFVEAPSQAFEEWAYSREVLGRISKHVDTGAPLPEGTLTSLLAARKLDRALDTQHQVFLALLDLDYHTREPGFEPTKLLQDLQTSVDAFAYVPKTHPESSFGHLVSYDAGYYGYQWSLAIARDLLTRFKAEGFLEPKVSAAFRDEVLAKGSGEEPGKLVARFLGREPSDAAYLDYLNGRD